MVLAIMPRVGASAPVTKPVTGRAAVASKDNLPAPVAKPDSTTRLPAPDMKVSAPDTTAGVVSIPASRDSTYGPAAPRPRRTLPKPGRFDQPRWVMLRSLLVPGWGQVHNHAWIKAALLAAGDGSLRVRAFRDERRLSDLNGQANTRQSELEGTEIRVTLAQQELEAAQAAGDTARIVAAEAALLAANLAQIDASNAYNTAVAAYNALLDSSTNRRWLLGGVVLYAVLDAYVDAHLKSFDIDFEFDPALPGGPPSPGGRLRLRWFF